MKHIATYPLYRTHPLSLAVMTGSRNRIGTGYLYSAEDIDKVRRRLAERGHPLHIRWRNDECRADYIEECRANGQFGVGA